MARLIEAAADPSYPAEIAAVVADAAGTEGQTFAESRGIRAIALPRDVIDGVPLDGHGPYHSGAP